MKYGDGRGVKTQQWFPNEIFRDADINRVGTQQYQNLIDLLASLSDQETHAEVFRGLQLVHTTDFTASLKTGVVIDYQGPYMVNGTFGFVSEAKSPFIVPVPVDTLIAFDDATAQTGDRRDSLEIRPTEAGYNALSRNFKDPVTGLVSTAVVNTGLEYGFEFTIKKGAAILTQESDLQFPAETGASNMYDGRYMLFIMSRNAAGTIFRQSVLLWFNTDGSNPVPQSVLDLVESDNLLYAEIAVTSLDSGTVIATAVDAAFTGFAFDKPFTTSRSTDTITFFAAKTGILSFGGTATGLTSLVSDTQAGAYSAPPARTAGWIKIAEVEIVEGASDLGIFFGDDPIFTWETLEQWSDFGIDNTLPVGWDIRTRLDDVEDGTGIQAGAIEEYHLGFSILAPVGEYEVAAGESVEIGDMIERLINGTVKTWDGSTMDEFTKITRRRLSQDIYSGTDTFTVPFFFQGTNNTIWFTAIGTGIQFVGILDLDAKGEVGIWPMYNTGDIAGNRTGIVALDDERAYLSTVGAGTIIGKVVKRNGTDSLTEGTPVTEEASGGAFNKASLLSADKVLVTWVSGATFKANHYDISDMTITKNTPDTVGDSSMGYPIHCIVSEDKAYGFWFKSGTGIRGVVIDTSGVNPSLGSIATIDAAAWASPALWITGTSMIDDTHVLLVMRDTGAAGFRLVTVTESGGTLSGGTIYTPSAFSQASRLHRLTKSKYLICSSTEGMLIEYDTSTYVVTFGTPFPMGTAGEIAYSDRQVLAIDNDADPSFLSLIRVVGEGIKRCVGFAQTAAADGATCEVVVPGGILTGLSSLVSGTVYGYNVEEGWYSQFKAFEDYTLESIVNEPVGLALSTTTMLILDKSRW